MGHRPVDVGPGDRAELLERRRTLKMAKSAHAYVRGATAEFYRWLEVLDPKNLPSGPPIWICGDCHLGNLGPLADAAGHVDVQIRDLDQTVISNPAFDLIRLGLSLASAARGSNLPGVTTASMLEEMIRGYSLALRECDWDGEVLEPEVVRSVRRRALGRRWKHLANERLQDVSPAIPRGSKFWSLTDEERGSVRELLTRSDVHHLVLSLNARTDADEVELLDAAYWRKGCSSLGRLRYAALLSLSGGSRVRSYALLDLKEAAPPLPPIAPEARMPGHNGERVVAGARALSPNLGERMIAGDVLARPVVVRELAPQDLKLEVDQFTRDEAVAAARYLAFVVGRAHAAQLDQRARREWADELARHHSKQLDAPGWLWTSVVMLAARHEQGYLEHCRRYALQAA